MADLLPSEPSDQKRQLPQLFHPQGGSSGCHDDKRVLPDHIRPGGRNPPKLSGFVVEVDPVLAPGLSVIE